MVNLVDVIKRAKKIKSFDSDKDFAELLSISAPDFSKRKKSGTLLPRIIDWAIAEKVNLDWLLTGKEERKVSQANTGDRPEIIELLLMTRQVLESNTHYAFSLQANIESFHRGMNAEGKIDDLERRVSQIEREQKKEVRFREGDPESMREEILRRRVG